MAFMLPQTAAARRAFLRGGLALAATGATHGVVSAQTAAPSTQPSAPPRFPAQPPDILSKRIQRTGDVVPALGLGTFLTFDQLPGAPRAELFEVIGHYLRAGVRVVDTSPLYGSAEVTVGDAASALGATDQLFLANKIWSTGAFLADEGQARRSLEESQLRLWRRGFDLMQCHSLVNVDVVLPLMAAWKKEGLIRMVGVTHHENDYHEVLAKWIRRGVVDAVQVNYSIANRAAESTVLRAAQEAGVAVFINMPLEKGRLHKAIGQSPLPAFAGELGIQNWAQYFLKFVMSHPAVTCCLSATANPAHALENIGALRGPLPDAALRARMVQYVEGLPGFAQVQTLLWYPDKQSQYQGLIRRAQAALRARQ